MLVSLCNDGKRGVDVLIVTTGIPDKKMIFLLTQSHYEPLLKCGVKIYQYTPGFIHAKSFLCDDKIGTVGSTCTVKAGLHGYICGFRGNDIGILQRSECVHSYFPGHDASVCAVAVKW